MAAKVALTAEEFRENSQRSIALFNTEKLSTDSTHVLKSAYCNSVHFCRCNLHGACGGKAPSMAYCKSLVIVAICTGRVEAKNLLCFGARCFAPLQSARGVWRQRCTSISSVLLINRCNLHGACGGKVSGEDIHFVNLLVAICTGRVEDLASSPEKNPRKFMQTYCIFIHLGV